ncbi:MAG: hypothetical protein ABSE73_02550 [Planctomycetota bacterium]
MVLMLSVLAGCKSQKPAQQPDGGAAAANTVEKSVERGPVRMTVRVSPKEPRLSDLLDLEIVVEAEAGVEVRPPVFGKAVGDFLVRDYRAKDAPAAGEKTVRNFHYQLEPRSSGKHLIRSVGIEFSDHRPGKEGKGEPVLLETEPLEILVTSELGDKTPSLADLAPMHSPVPLPPSPFWFWVLGLSGLGAALAGAALWYRRHRKSAAEGEAKKTPEETAHAEMRALLARNLHGKGEFKEFYVGLTGIVRRYIEATTGIRAPEQTTEEFLRDVRAREVFPRERAAQFGQFLEAADLVKYAAMQPGTRQVEEAIARAQEFVGLPSAFQVASGKQG